MGVDKQFHESLILTPIRERQMKQEKRVEIVGEQASNPFSLD